MASLEIQRLWKLAQVDASINEIRLRAGRLDVGQRIQAELDVLQAEEAEVGGAARKLSAELTDLELANKTLDDKIKKVEKDLYGGKIVNPREVEAYEKEIAILKRKRSVNDEAILELWDKVPPAKEAAAKVQERLDEAKKRLVERRKAAAQDKTALESDFARLNQARPDMAKLVPPALLARYEDIRKKNAGIGMVMVVKMRSCAGCGTLLPERTLQALKDERPMTCETCHRLLYYTEGLV